MAASCCRLIDGQSIPQVTPEKFAFTFDEYLERLAPIRVEVTDGVSNALDVVECLYETVGRRWRE